MTRRTLAPILTLVLASALVFPAPAPAANAFKKLKEALGRKSEEAAKPAPAAPAPAAPAAAGGQAGVAVAMDRPGRVIPRELFGTNIQWENNGDLILGPGDPKGEWWPGGILDEIKASGVTALRFPGGFLSDTYEWKAGIGPRAARPKGPSFTGAKVPSNFGTDEFIQLCRAAHLVPIVTVNFNSTPEDAADWVEYLNGAKTTPWGAKRAANGSAEPLTTRYWEIGNEFYSPGEPGHVDAKKYGEKVLRFASEMRKRSPGIKIGVTLDAAFTQAAWMPLVMPHMKTWNEEVLQACGKEVDFAIVHWYAPFDKVKGEMDLPRLIWSSPDVMRENLARLRVLLAKYCRPGVEIALTEYNTAFNDKGTLDPRIASTETALHEALILAAAIGEPDLTFANNWSLLNNGVFGIFETASQGKVVRRPTFEVFRELASLAGWRVLPFEASGEAYPVKAIGNIPDREKVLAIQGAAAAGPEGKVAVLLVNRSPDRPVSVRLSLTGGGGPAALKGPLLAPPVGAPHPAPAWGPPRELQLKPEQPGVFRVEMPPSSFALLRSSAP